MHRYQVIVDGADPVEVRARNWMLALGEAAGDVDMVKLSCETLANGTVLALDNRTGSKIVIHALDDDGLPMLPGGMPAPLDGGASASSLPRMITEEMDFAYDPDTSEYRPDDGDLSGEYTGDLTGKVRGHDPEKRTRVLIGLLLFALWTLALSYLLAWFVG